MSDPHRGRPAAIVPPRLGLLALLLPLAMLSVMGTLVFAAGSAGASPGSAYLVLTPAPAAGAFDADAYCTDPGGFAARAGEHPDGWAVAYLQADPPPGWTRPLIIRGGGPGWQAGAMHPHLAYAIEEMLPAREQAILALRDAPDPAACYPGKPHPQPFQRSGYLFLHDGRMDIEAVTSEIWLRSGDPDWDAFKVAHPRDYNGNGDPSLGNAGEIYFLALLYEISLTPQDVTGAFVRTLNRLREVPGYDSWQVNAVLQSAEGTWVLRQAPAIPHAGYAAFYGLTTHAEYWVADHLPDGAEAWTEIPNFTLAFFPAAGQPELVSTLSSGADGGTRLSAAQLSLRAVRCPAVGRVSLAYRTPLGSVGRLDLHDLEGRLVASWKVGPGAGVAEWTPPARLGDRVLWARLRWNGLETHRRILFLK